MGDRGPLPLGLDCSECGHCVAICPVNAVSLHGYDMGEVIHYSSDLA
jgi:MinD superfamily P-loop ATPase